MQEIFKKINQIDKTNIDFEVNPQSIIGGSMTREHRLLYFDTEQTDPLYIDFIPHNGTTDTIYLIPSGHLLYLPNSTTNFHCINVPHKCLNNIEKYWIYNLKYKSGKDISFSTSNIQLQNRIITQVLASNFIGKQNTPSLQYIQQAELLIEYIHQTRMTNQFSINDCAEILNTIRKTVLRICSLVFKETPINIIRHHLFMCIIFQTISCQMQPLSEIANSLGFRDLSTFNRYVKTISGYTPKELRANFYHIRL